ncbi:MAG: hypothetical protein V4691_07390, partial [Pseudomonadota bacterium]
MSDGASNQRLRQIALLLAYSLFIAFGTAAMLIIQHRPIDARGQMMIHGTLGVLMEDEVSRERRVKSQMAAIAESDEIHF